MPIFRKSTQVDPQEPVPVLLLIIAVLLLLPQLLLLGLRSRQLLKLLPMKLLPPKLLPLELLLMELLPLMKRQLLML